MGKKSLIKSTTKKKKEDDKTSSKKSKKADSPPTGQTGETTTASTETFLKAEAVPVDPQALIFRVFASPELPKPAPQSAMIERSSAHMSAPDFVTADDPKESERIHTLLLQRYSMADVESAAMVPQPQPVPTDSIAEKTEPPAIETPVQPIESVEFVAAPAVPEPIEAVMDSEPPSNEPPPQQPLEPAQIIVPAVDESTAAPNAPCASPPLITSAEPSDPVIRYLKYGGLAFAALVLLLLGASYLNSTTYYPMSRNHSVEVWRGRFSPMGKVFVTTLEGYQLPAPVQEEYARRELFPMIFGYYLNKADALIDPQTTPNFQEIHHYLSNARRFVATSDMQKAVAIRLNTIELMTLLYKADVAISQGSAESLASASQYLAEARTLSANQPELELIGLKQAQVNALTSALSAGTAGTESPQQQAGVPAQAHPSH